MNLWRLFIAGALCCAVSSSGFAVPAADPNAAAEPTEVAPMTVGAALSSSTAKPGDSIAILGTVRLLAGWHTYASVPPGKPYIQTKWSIDPPAGLSPSGDWLTPAAVPDPRDSELTIYEGDKLTFAHPMKVADTASGEQTIHVSIFFQTCNLEHCLAPTRKSFDLKLSVSPAKS
jgi:DsbC/DsbD-like thiol-disulfide interchange protein